MGNFSYKISKYACKSTKMISEKRTIASKCLRLVSLIDRNLYFGVTSSVLLGHHCRFSGAQKCPCLGTIVPFLRHFSTLARHEYLLGVLFSDFLIIENVCIGFYIKIAVVDVWKNLYSREKLKSKYDFTLHPSSFRPEC